jgi:FdhD protein
MTGSFETKIWTCEKEIKTDRLDRVAAEEPLEIQLQGVGIAVVMRTPGDDLDLVRGFLVTEGVVESESHIRRVSHCDLASHPASEENVVQVTLQPHVTPDMKSLKRHLFASSSCGICGKATIENVLRRQPPIHDAVRIEPKILYGLGATLRENQALFTDTGGLHAAGLFDPDGTLLRVYEDVGRHNAIDKVIGWSLRSGRFPLNGTILMLSGRISFEVIQKAAAAQIPIVCGVSAPTSLAVQTAEATGITLVGFLRGETCNIYSGPERVSP